MRSHRIQYHEKTQGQLFCNDKASVLVDALLKECRQHGVNILLKTQVDAIKTKDDGYAALTTQGTIECDSLVIATGGLSIPSMGSSPFAYQLAQQFDMPVVPTRAALVPFTLDVYDKKDIEPLSGIAFPCALHTEEKGFNDDLLFTHRGLSGPAAYNCPLIGKVAQPSPSIASKLMPHRSASPS